LEKYRLSIKKSKNRLQRRRLFEFIMFDIHAGSLSKRAAGNDLYNLVAA